MGGRGFGRGRGPGRGRGRQRRIMGIIQPCILLQLMEGDAHGYALLEGLGDFIEEAERYDSSVVYRVMREMENMGWLTSYSGETSLGPRRKMYRLTGEGEGQLKRWMEDLKRSKKEIDRLIAGYEKKTEQNSKED